MRILLCWGAEDAPSEQAVHWFICHKLTAMNGNAIINLFVFHVCTFTLQNKLRHWWSLKYFLLSFNTKVFPSWFSAWKLTKSWHWAQVTWRGYSVLCGGNILSFPLTFPVTPLKSPANESGGGRQAWATPWLCRRHKWGGQNFRACCDVSSL